jgi:O-antigen/teichoic acid export membrane protein
VTQAEKKNVLTSQRLPSRRRAVSLNFIAQITGLAFVTIQGIFLVPLYLRFVGIPLYGAWLASMQLVGWVTILDPGTDEVMRQRLATAYGGGQLDELGQIIGTGLAINGFVAICITVATMLLIPELPVWFRVSGQGAGQLTSAAVVLALASGTTVVAYALGSSLQALQRAGGYGVVLVIGNIAGLVLNVGLLYAGWGLTAIAAGFLFKAVVWAGGWSCVLIWTCRPLGREPVRFSFSAHRARELIRLAGYMLVSKIASMLQTSSDGVLTAIMLGPSQTAMLVLTGKVVDVARMIPDRLGAAMQPSLAHLAGVGNRERSLRISTHFLVAASLVAAPLIATAVVLNRDVVRLWVGARLYGGQPLSALIGISSLLTLLSTAIYHVLFANGLIETTSKISLVAGAVKIVLLAVLLRWLGLIAVPIATTAAILIVTGPRYLRVLSETFSLDSGQVGQLLVNVLSGPMVCVILGAILASSPSAPTWLAAALKSAAILGLFTGTILALLPVARREALTALGNVIAWSGVRGRWSARA